MGGVKLPNTLFATRNLHAMLSATEKKALEKIEVEIEQKLEQLEEINTVRIEGYSNGG